MADVGLPHAALREQVADAFDLVVCQARAADGTRRVIEVAEVVRVAAGPAAREIYAWRGGRARWRAALSDGLAAKLAAAGPDPARSRDAAARRRAGAAAFLPSAPLPVAARRPREPAASPRDRGAA